MKRPSHDTPIHLAWEEYKLQPYYAFWAEQAGLDVDCPETAGVLWWIFSKGYEAAINKTDK